MLQYGLTENTLTPTPDDYSAVTQNVRSYTDEEIVEQMMQRGTTITRTDVKAVLQLYKEVIADLVADGAAVNTEIMNISPSISGVFTSATGSFDASRHKVNVNLSPGTALRKARERIVTQKVMMQGTVPRISEVLDVVSGALNSTLTPSGVLRLSGTHLKFIAGTETNGVFLIEAEKGTEVPCKTVVTDKPSEVTVQLPASLAAGTYFVEIRTTYSTSAKEAKTLKTGRFAKVLSVEGGS